MTIDLSRLIFDFGLVVLIWIVQLVVYPSFKYYTKDNLVKWHQRYTNRISFVVMPLMLGQLFIGGYQLVVEKSWYTLSSACIILALWLITFLFFIPLHNQISNQTHSEKTLAQLVTYNWVRTVLWTALFLISLLYFSN